MSAISITRALVELKRSDDRINRETSSGKYVGITIGRGQNRKVYQANASVEEASRIMQSSFDSVFQLIENRRKLKAAIVLSNATTKVEIAGRIITVAEAIELKHTIDAKVKFRDVLRLAYRQAQMVEEKMNAQMEQAIEVSVNTIYNNDRSKVDPDAYEMVAKGHRDSKEAAILDPSNILSVIEKLDTEIDAIKGDLDFVLSESNARTTIDVDF